ncbi:MAG TPA: hypothetical protein VIL63_12685 [Terriglobales bacterium]
MLGARQRKALLKREEEWHLYESGLILEIDTNTGAVETRVDYKTPPEARASDHSSNVFKSGTIAGDKLYTCTSTEVLTFQLPEFEIINYISLPCFNDLHHVTPDSDGNLLVTSTGLEMVVKVDLEGSVLRQWNVLGEDPWEKFSREVDYRKVESTKPHRSHPNYVFELDGRIFATRFMQRDAICLTDPSQRIDIGVQAPHDGLVRGNKVYFTTVDGRVVIVNRHSLQVEDVVDLKAINGETALLGWCRGLMGLGDGKFWVGFTRVRKTKFRDNVLWVRSIFHDGMPEKPTHMAIYDLPGRECLQEFDLEAHGMNVVFSIFPAVNSPVRSEQMASPLAEIAQRR